MRFKYLLGFIIIVITYSFSVAQNKKMVLNYKDGSSLTGLGKVISEKKIKFKKTKSSKAEKLGYNDLKNLDYIAYYDEDGIEVYQFARIKNNKTLLLERKISGEISLYSRVRITGGTYMPMAGGTTGGYWTPGTLIKNYYVKRHNEEWVTHLGSNQLFTKNFKKAMSEYVQDCPTLVTKIENKEYKKKHLVEIIEYYNENCGE